MLIDMRVQLPYLKDAITGVVSLVAACDVGEVDGDVCFRGITAEQAEKVVAILRLTEAAHSHGYNGAKLDRL